MNLSLTPAQVDALLAGAGPGSVVHLVGAGGCGMSGLGHLLLDLGHRVTGSDIQVNEEVMQLHQRGARIQCGHGSSLIQESTPVLVVFTPAVRMDNPELLAARAAGIPAVRRAVLLAALLRRQHGVAVAGMHGKTTTSAMLSFALESLGAQPSYAIGSLVSQLRHHARFTAGQRLFVIEADESDGTLGLFRPHHSILLNVDAEHLDHFADLAAVCQEFSGLVAQTSGFRFYCKDDPNLCRLLDGQLRAVSFGFHPDADYQAVVDTRGRGAAGDSPAARFSVRHQGRILGEFSLSLFGEKNVSNATAVVAFLHHLGHIAEDIARALAPFRGAARRQQQLFASDQVRIVDDYGHHPTEIRATLRAFKDSGPGRLLVAFQPHRFTRTQHLMNDFATAFGDADLLWLTEIYAASEPPIPGISSAVLAQAIRAQGKAVTYVPELKDLGRVVMQSVQPGDMVLFLGAGDITKVAHDVAAELTSVGGTPSSQPDRGGVNSGIHCSDGGHCQKASRADGLDLAFSTAVLQPNGV